MRNPILSYIVIAAISLICAISLFMLGGSLAEVTGNDTNFLGFGFKASGAIAGFIIIFWISQKTILKFHEKYSLINMKVYLTSKPNNFKRNDASYEAEYIVFNEDTGDSNSFSISPFWEAGYLTVLIKDVGEKDYLTVKVKNSGDELWESDSFHSRSPKITELIKLN